MIVPDLVNDALFVCHLSRAAPKALVVVLGDHHDLGTGELGSEKWVRRGLRTKVMSTRMGTGMAPLGGRHRQIC